MPLDATLDSLLTLWPALTPEQRVLVRDMAGSVHTGNLYRSDVLIVVADHLRACEAVVEAARALVADCHREVHGEHVYITSLGGQAQRLVAALAALDAARPADVTLRSNFFEPDVDDVAEGNRARADIDAAQPAAPGGPT